jgi:hypothetical protein
MFKNKSIFLLFFLLFVNIILAQSVRFKIGTNPYTISPSAAFEIESTSRGFLPPRMTDEQINAIPQPEEGLVVYSMTSKCLKYFNSGVWSNCLVNGMPATVIVNCNTNGFSGSFIKDVPFATTNTFSITIVNNSFLPATISFSTTDLVLSGVSGIVVSSVSTSLITLNTGQSQVIEYTLSGTPLTTGILNGIWTKLALTCTNSVAIIN